MKLKKILMFLFLFHLSNSIIANLSQSLAPTSTSSDILMSAQVPLAILPAMKHLHDTVPSYPIRAVLNDGTIQQGITNRTVKAVPLSGKSFETILSKGHFSVLLAKKDEFKNYPSGASIFPGHAAASAKFDAMIAFFQANPEMIAFFRKVHINILNQLYHHLMSVCVNFNLQHVGIVQTQAGTLQVDIPAFLTFEKEYGSNNKTLIINHLVNIIESQFNSSIRSYVPNLPQQFASFLGKTLIYNDYSIDLTKFLDQQVEAGMIAYKQKYLQGLAVYLDFFQTYTSYLLKEQKKGQSEFTEFVRMAENINQFLYGDADPKADKELIAIKKMNPPLFSFTYDDIRALKMIPYLAKTLPKNSKKIMWPEHIVQAANQGIVLTIPGQAPHPIAYFKNSLGSVVKNMNNDPAIKLFICMRSGQNLFEEELIAEPDWLNSWSGVAGIMRACFGDFSALLGLNILDPCMETLIQLVIAVQKGQDPNSLPTRSDACSTLLNLWKQSSSTAFTISNPAGLQVAVPNLGLPNLQADNLPLPSLDALQQG
jgi:hypothetical protein